MNSVLTEFVSQPIVAQLGWTLIHFVWQAMLVAMVAAVGLRLSNKSSANVRYFGLCACMLAMAIAPVVTFAWLLTNDKIAGVAEAQPAVGSDGSAATPPLIAGPPPALTLQANPNSEPIIQSAVVQRESFRPSLAADAIAVEDASKSATMRNRVDATAPWIVAAWMTGVVLLSLWHLAGWILIRRMTTKRTSVVTGATRVMMDELKQLLRIGANVQLLQSATTPVPLVVGCVKPVLLLPASAITGLPQEQLRALLAHELAHIRRHDYLVNLIQSVVETFLFYHPAVWWLSGRIRSEREYCADDLAATMCQDADSYALALVSLAETVVPVAKPAVAASGGSLTMRIHRLLGLAHSGDRASSRPSWLLSSVLGLTVALGLMIATKSGAVQVEQDDSPTAETLAKELLKNPMLQDYQLKHVDQEPSVGVKGFRGYRVVLHKEWLEYPESNIQQAAPKPVPQAGQIGPPTEIIKDAWEFVLVPIKPKQPPVELKSSIPWQKSNCPYHTGDVCLGEGDGYMWYTRGMTVYQHSVRKQMKLTGGDDPIQILVDGLLTKDKGDMTANSVPFLIAEYEERALPYIEKAIEKTQQAGIDPWKAVTCLSPIHNDASTKILLRLFNSGEEKLRRPAMYALIHEPFREPAKREYLEILSERRYLPRITKACLQYGWQEALPILEQIADRPSSIYEYRDALRGQRALAGDPIAPELLAAEETLGGANRIELNAEQAKAIETAKQLLIESTDTEGANLSAVLLAIITRKGNMDPVRAVGRDILHARPKQSTIDFLESLADRLPERKAKEIKELSMLVLAGKVQHVGDDPGASIAWGEEVGGIKAGISFDSFPVPHPIDRIRLGDAIHTELVVKNSSDHVFEFQIAPGLVPPRVHHATGPPVVVNIPPFDGGIVFRKYKLKPGEMATLPIAPCTVGLRPPIDNVIGCHAYVGLGEYNVSAAVHLSPADLVNGAPGTSLETGVIKCTVIPADRQAINERFVSKLKDNADQLSCKVVYLGLPERRLPSVGLMRADFQDEYPAPWKMVNINERAALAIIEFLEKEGLLYRYISDPEVAAGFPLSSYFLSIEVDRHQARAMMIPLRWSEMKRQLGSLGEAVGGKGAVALQSILDQPMMSDWHHVAATSLVAVSARPQLYYRKDDPHFYLRFRLTNRSKSTVYVDLSDYNHVFHPNQWGFHRDPRRFIVDEERVIPLKLTDTQKLDLVQRSRQGKLTQIAPGSSVDFYREFNGGARDAVKQQEKENHYMIISVDGQLMVTDGKRSENVHVEWDNRGLVTEATTDVVIAAPVTFAQIPADARVIEPR